MKNSIPSNFSFPLSLKFCRDNHLKFSLIDTTFRDVFENGLKKLIVLSMLRGVFIGCLLSILLSHFFNYV